MQGVKIRNTTEGHTTPFNSIGDCLIATLQPDVNDLYLHQLGQDVSNALQWGEHRTLILDATPLELIDTTDFDCLRRVIDMARLMGTETIIAGLKPGVVVGLVEFDANIDGLVTTLNLKTALTAAGQAG